jgi:hypothetical protein
MPNTTLNRVWQTHLTNKKKHFFSFDKNEHAKYSFMENGLSPDTWVGLSSPHPQTKSSNINKN